MKFLIQAVNIQKCIILFKKAVASAIIFSMLMIDVAKAMDEERGSRGVVQRIPPPNPSAADLDLVDSDSSLKQSHSSDDGDSSPGSISSSPEKSKPGGEEGDNQSLAIIPFVKLSLVPPQSSIVPLSEQKPGENGRKPVAPPTFPDDSDDEYEFSPLDVVGSLEHNRQSIRIAAGLPTSKDFTGNAKRIPLTTPIPPTFISTVVTYPQVQSPSLIGSSPNGTGSLQDRSPSYMPSPHSVPQNHNNSGKSTIPAQSNLVLVSTGSHPLEDSDTGSDDDDQGTIRLLEVQKPSPNSSLPDLRSGREFPPAPSVVFPKRPGTNIDGVVKALLLDHNSPNPLFPDEEDESLPTGQKAANTSPPPSSPQIFIGQRSEKSPLLEHQTLSQQYSSIQGDNPTLVVEIGEAGDDPEVHVSIGGDNSSACCSCCPNHPCWPQHTEYTLPNAQHKLQQLSQKLSVLRQTQSREGSNLVSSQPNGRLIEFKPLPNSDGQDESADHSDGSGGSIDVSSSSSNDNSPVKRLPPLILAVEDKTTSEEEQGDFFLPADLLKDSQTSDEEEGQLPPPGSGSLLGSPHSISSHHDEDEEEEVVLPAAPGLQDVFEHIGDLESGVNVQSVASFQKFCTELQSYLKSLPSKTKSQLKDYVHQVLNGKSTWPQRLGKWVIGPIIGIAYAYTMGPIYDGGIDYLGNQYEAFHTFLLGPASTVLIDYVMISSVPDGVARNAHLWKKGITYLFQEGKEIGRMCLAGGISFFTSLIPLAYLITAENIGRQLLGDTGWNNEFGIFVGILGPFVLADAFASDFNTSWTAIPAMKEWLGNLFCRKSLHARVLSLEETQREKFESDLGKLKNFLFRAPPVVIEEIYGDIKQIKESLQTSFCGTLDEDLAPQQAFATMSYLLSLGDEVVKGISKPQSLYDISADIFKYACLVFGTPARAIALQFIGYSVFSLFCPDLVAQILGGVYALLAFLPQTFMEDQGIDNFSKRFIFEEDSHGHSSHLPYRVMTKLYCAFQGLVYVFPLTVLTLQAFQQWFGNGWWPLAAMVPFIIPEFAAQTYSFNGTYNQQVTTAITNIHNTKTLKCLGKEPTANWKRDWLIRFIETSRNDLKHWHSDLIKKLTETVLFLQKPHVDEL